MNGLRSRLESLTGVEGIELELGDKGLEGITVRLEEGADERSVLEGVRRLLVAYGTKSPRVMASAASGSEQSSAAVAPAHEVLDLDESPSEMLEEPPVRVVSSGEDSATMVTSRGHDVELVVTPAGDRSTARIVFSRGGRTVRRQVPSSARAIVQAVIDAAAELSGRDPISVVGMNLSSIDGTRVLTVIVGNHGMSPLVSTVSVVDRNWPAALLEVVADIIEVGSAADS